MGCGSGGGNEGRVPLAATVAGSTASSRLDADRARGRSLAGRRVAALLVLAMAVVPMAQAQVFRAFEQRYTTTLNGDLVFLANSSMTCNSTSGSCTGATNDAQTMVATKLAADAADSTISNSSSANLAATDLPAGAQVVRAMLYWGGLVASNAGSQPTPSPAATPIRFGRPGLGYQTLVPASCDVSPRSTIWGTAQPHHVYGCRADVTAAVQASGTGQAFDGMEYAMRALYVATLQHGQGLLRVQRVLCADAIQKPGQRCRVAADRAQALLCIQPLDLEQP